MYVVFALRPAPESDTHNNIPQPHDYQMKRIEHIAMIAHDMGRIFEFLGIASLLPFLVLVIFREWNMLLPMAICSSCIPRIRRSVVTHLLRRS